MFRNLSYCVVSRVLYEQHLRIIAMDLAYARHAGNKRLHDCYSAATRLCTVQASLMVHPVDISIVLEINTAAEAASLQISCGHTQLSLSRPALDTGAITLLR